MHRRLLSAAAATALLLGLAACGEPNNGPVTTAPPSIDISSGSDGGGAEPSDGGGETAEPTAAAPDIPPPDPADYAGMDEHTPEGAEQAFKYYIAVTYWGYQTGSSDIHQTLYDDNCQTCKDSRSEIEEISRAATYWSDVTISSLGTSTFDSKDFEIEVGYIYTVSDHLEATSESQSPKTTPSQSYTAAAGMEWVDGKWIIGGLKIGETSREVE